MSPVEFDWFLTLVTGVVAGIWVIFDARALFRMRTVESTDPKTSDRRFGYVMGILIGTLGVIGSVKHHLG